MLALKGIIQGGFIVLENEDLREYDGKDVIVTILDAPFKQLTREVLEQDQLVTPTERGTQADFYLEGLRNDDRF